MYKRQLFSFLGLYSQNINYTAKVIPKEKIGVHNQNFKLNGFYYNKKLRVDNIKDTVYAIKPMIFYKNGIYMGFHTLGNSSKRFRKKVGKQKCILKPRQNFYTIINFFKCYVNIANRKEITSVYSVNEAIIRIQHINKHIFIEERGVVLNDSTFLINKRIDYIKKNVKTIEDIYHFKASNKPDSTEFIVKPKIKTWFFK